MGVVDFTLSHPMTVIGGVNFSCLDRRLAAQRLIDLATNGLGGYVCVTGAHGVIAAQDDAEFKNVINSASMNTLDGQPVTWIARWRGFKVTRVTGRELVWDVVDLDASNRIRHVLFGATALVTGQMIERLRARSPGIQIEAFNPPFGLLSDDYLYSIFHRNKFQKPTIVWVGLSTPKQELLAARIAERLPETPVVAIGAGFDFVAELKRAAPPIITLLCLEWLFRLVSEPRRLLMRYASIIPRFSILAIREIAKGKTVSSQSSDASAR